MSNRGAYREEDYYDEDDFYAENAGQKRDEGHKKQLTLAEEKAALK